MTLLFSSLYLSFFSYAFSHSSLTRLTIKYWNSSYFRPISFHSVITPPSLHSSIGRVKDESPSNPLSLIFNVLWAQHGETEDKLTPFFAKSPQPDFMPGYPIIDTYWFDMNYGDPSPTCDPTMEYSKMLESGPLCNCYLYELAVMGSEFIRTIPIFVHIVSYVHRICRENHIEWNTSIARQVLALIFD